MLQFCVLASGSKANCCFVSSRNTRILVDCGLSARQVVTRLRGKGIDPQTIEAVLVTHEHSDHVCGIRVFTSSFQIPVYTTIAALRTSTELQSVEPHLLRSFVPGEPFLFGDLCIEPMSISHDAADPVAFRIETLGTQSSLSMRDVTSRSMAIVTDLGVATQLIQERIRGVSALVLESNHDIGLLENCSYPWSLKQRIRSRTGHLSNCEAKTLLEELYRSGHGRLEFLIGAHISEQSNTKERALDSLAELWDEHATWERPHMMVANPYAASDVFNVG